MGNWKEEYRFGTFVIWPPTQVRSQINRLRERYDPRSHAICEAHVTVTQPFLSPPESQDWDRLIPIVSTFEASQITYGPLDHFLPYPCIYYEIQPLDWVLNIRRSLHETGLFNLELPHTSGFVPHMSITDGMPDIETTRDIFEKLEKELSGGTFMCDALAFIEPDEQFVFHVSRLFQFT